MSSPKPLEARKTARHMTSAVYFTTIAGFSVLLANGLAAILYILALLTAAQHILQHPVMRF